MALEGPKAARGREITSAQELGYRIFHEGAGAPEHPRPTPPEDEVRENTRVFSDGGRVVSVVHMTFRRVVLLGTRHLACAFGGVCTDPDYRGRGLASRLLEDARQRALERGADLVLISGSRGLYLRQGYVRVGAFNVASVRRRQVPSEGRYLLRRGRPEDVPALLGIYAAEPTRFERSRDEWRSALARDRVLHAPGGVRLVCPEGDDTPVAFVAYRLGGAPWERKDPRALSVIEAGGARDAIIGALGPLMDEHGASEVEVYYSDCDAQMRALADALGWRSEPFTFRGTVGIIDPVRFWDTCAPLFAEQLGDGEFSRLRFEQRGGGAAIACEDERLVLPDMAALTRLVFTHGAHREELTAELGPDSPLRRILEQLFPLPLVNYGLNYY